MWVRPFLRTFHTPKHSIWAKSDENFLQKVLPTYFSTFQNLRLVTITLLYKESIEKKSNASSSSLRACVFGKPILQMFYKNAKSQTREQRIVIVVSLHACVLVNPSRKCFTKMQSVNPKKKQRIVMSLRACVFVNPCCKYFTKIQTHPSQPSATHP